MAEALCAGCCDQGPDANEELVKNLRGSLERAKDVQLRGVDNFVKSQKTQMEAEIAKAREKVKALGGSFPTE